LISALLFQKNIHHLLDIDRAESVFSLFFIFVLDPAMEEDEQISLHDILNEIFLGLSLPKGASRRLRSLYMKTRKDPPQLSSAIDRLIQDLQGDKDALLSFVKILLRIISDDGMISNRHCKDLSLLLGKCNFSRIEHEEFSDEEQVLIHFALTGEKEIPDTPFSNLSAFYACLGCKDNAPLEEVKSAYRLLAMQFHPDRIKVNSDNENRDESIKKFQDIQIAYSTIINAINRE
jgi:hypothetical protein